MAIPILGETNNLTKINQAKIKSAIQYIDFGLTKRCN